MVTNVGNAYNPSTGKWYLPVQSVDTRLFPNKSKKSKETGLFDDRIKEHEHISEEITRMFTMVNN